MAEPARASRLFALQPLYSSVTGTESLTSYIIRLADAHFVPPHVIVLRELAPLLKNGELARASRASDMFSNIGKAVNGLTHSARDTVALLQALGGRTDLAALSMLPWASLLPSRGLLRDSQSWCPLCLRDTLAANRPLSYPLLWSLQGITVCHYHKVSLANRCPTCSKTVKFLDWNSTIGYCDHCQTSLATLPDLSQPELAFIKNSVLDEELHATLAAVELLTTPVEAIASPTPAIFSRNIDQLLEAATSSSIRRFARILRVSRPTVTAWKDGSARPQLSHVIRISRRFGVRAVDLLCGNLNTPERHPVSSTATDLSGKLKSEAVPQIKLKIKICLKAAANAQLPSPPSLSALCRELHADHGYVKRIFPELSQAISRRHKALHATRIEDRRNGIRAELRRAITTIKTAGRVPNFNNVGKLLAKPNQVRERWVQSEWQSVVASVPANGVDLATEMEFLPHQVRQMDLGLQITVPNKSECQLRTQ
jgi:DNA-binding transcriptional regulator YiaG